MPEPKDYKFIAAWGRLSGSFEYYIKGEQERAAADNAPLNAIYKRDGVWRTTDDITSNRTRDALGLPVRVDGVE